MMCTVSRILNSSSYTPGLPGVEASFPGTSRTVSLLGLTTYLFGLALGNLTLTPFCEIYGRRPVHLASTALFTVMIIPVASAPNLTAIMLGRFFSGFLGSATLATAPGSVNDLVSGKDRALAISCWSLGTMNAPVIGKISPWIFPYLHAVMLMHTRADNGWFRVSAPRMAMDQLACTNMRWSFFHRAFPIKRNLCTGSAESKRKKKSDSGKQ